MFLNFSLGMDIVMMIRTMKNATLIEIPTVSVIVVVLVDSTANIVIVWIANNIALNLAMEKINIFVQTIKLLIIIQCVMITQMHDLYFFSETTSKKIN